MSCKMGDGMFINWVRLGLGLLLVVYWVYPVIFLPVWSDTQKVVWTLLFCFSLLIIALAFERKKA